MFRTMVIVNSVLLCGSVCATTLNTISPAKNSFVVGIGAGPAWISGNKTQTIQLQSDVAKTYTGNEDDSAFPTGELFLGWQRGWCIAALNKSFISQLGLSVVDSNYAKLKGDIWEDANPAFDNYTYNYKVNHAHVAVKGRLIGDYHRFVDPYISASLGVGFNRAFSFVTNPKTTAEVAPPPFSSNTTTTFTYSLGIGIQKSLLCGFAAAIGYEFTDWGRTQLGRARSQTLNQGPTLNHLYANQVLLSLFYST